MRGDKSRGLVHARRVAFRAEVKAAIATMPDPEPLTNSRRAQWAQVAINAFRRETGADPNDALSDLLCDLMHLYGRERFASELQRARRHHRVECAEDPA